MEKAIWQQSTPEQKVILVTLLTMANHKGKQWIWKGEKFEADAGQFVTSLDRLVKKCGIGIKIQSVRTALTKFEKLEFLTNQSTKTGRLITIVNWQVYQANEDSPNIDANKDLTKSQQRPNKDLTPNKNDKNVKNDKKNIYSDEFEIFWSEYPKEGHQNSKPQSFKNFKNLVKKKIDPNSLIQSARNYATDCKTLSKTEYLYKASNFIGQSEYYKSYLDDVWEPAQQELFTNKPKLNKREQQLDEIGRMFEEYDRCNSQQNNNDVFCKLS